MRKRACSSGGSFNNVRWCRGLRVWGKKKKAIELGDKEVIGNLRELFQCSVGDKDWKGLKSL